MRCDAPLDHRPACGCLPRLGRRAALGLVGALALTATGARAATGE